MIGFVNVYKPSGMTSSNVVVKLRKLFHIDKIGHFGTLDPMACGVLPIAVGKATRMFDYYLAKYKTYKATFEFGYITDTLDSTGEIVDRVDKCLTREEVELAIKSMLGLSMQTPPSFSAKLVNGVRAYKLARNGEIVELKPKEIEITKFELLSFDNNVCEVEITCSSGTYIRSIARDLGYAVGSLCTMTALERIESGVFNLSNSTSLEDLLRLDSIEDKLIDLETVFPNMRIIELNETSFFKIRNGIAIDNSYDVDTVAFAKYNNMIVGVVERINNKLKLKTFLME